MQAYTSPGRTLGFFGDNRLIIWCLGVVVAAAIILTGYNYNRHNISIYADGKEVKLIMRGGTVADALKKAKIAVSEKDIIKPSMATALKQDQKINITRMIRFTVLADGKELEYWAKPGSVRQALTSLNLALNPGDAVAPGLETKLTPGQNVEITRFAERIITQPIKIPFKVERRDDSSKERGYNKVVQEGHSGLLQRTVKITLKNGEEVKREVIGEEIVSEPVNKIVAVGTMRVKVVSRGKSIRFSRSLIMNSSAYSHTGNRTASGVYPHRGAVAVDPRVIPLGTRLYVEGYGYAKALDIGSAIDGNRIDLFFDTTQQAYRWGRRSVKVYIIN
ncbi:MAG TPA: 3D domain-containing protein [Desulfobacteria bacterium]|nr:3D domain-containing protein [Desulfobacteria bacterium]